VDRLTLGNPRLIGFGIGNWDTFGAACRYASGAIVGSKFGGLLQEAASPQEAVAHLLDDLGK
jgi:tryptophan synthase alpha chain